MAHGADDKRVAQSRERPLTLESMVKVAVVAALAVNALDLLVIIFRGVLRGDEIDLFRQFQFQLIGVVGQAALFGAATAAYVRLDDRDFLLKLAGAVYVGSFLQSVLNALFTGLFTDASGSLDPISTVFGSLFLVTTFFGLVATMRLFKGQTIFPGVDYRL